MSRLAHQGEYVDRTRPVRFTFDGRPVEAFAGDTIGSALWAAGRTTISRSFKYHRRRGLLCCAGQCPNCLVAVDGAPGVRACTEPVREGMQVRHLNARPSLDLDVMRITDLAGGPLTPPGFYYKTFKRPRRLWPLYEKVLRGAAGLGTLPGHTRERATVTEYRRRHCDVLVVGGGLAGLSAAIEAARLGADVVLVDEGPEPGGRLALDGLVPVWQGATLHQVRAQRLVFATGTIEQPLVFANNDLPGVMLAGGARRLATLYGVAPGRRAVVVTAGDAGLEAAAALRRVGVDVRLVADLRPDPSPRAAELGVEVLQGWTVAAARGGRGVAGATLAPVGGGHERQVVCDLLVVSGSIVPATSLLLQAGARSAYDADRGVFRLGDLPEHVHACGEIAGARGAEAIALSGAVAGREAAHALGLGDQASRAAEVREFERLAALPPARVEAVPPPAAGEGHGRCFACLCEDVTAKDLHLAVAEGFDELELAKRYTTVTMGPCQGRMCQLASARLVARETGRDVREIGLTTARPPWTPVPMGVLAGRPFEPAKRSAVHGRQREQGAHVQWAGDWRRAYDYGDPQGEAKAVHDAAGLIDVSTLGKLLVRGSEAGELLDRLYPNRLSNLKPGRIRYGVVTSDAGRVIDDGTICRLDDETFYVTTTSSGAGAMEEWFTWWLADWGLDVHVSDLTQGLAALNLAGPRARDILATLTDLDVSSEGFAYLDGREAEVAGVPCLLLRIGFVGEVGFEIHCPAAHGEHLWDAIIEAGRPHGLRPFGLEPQRILRLEKLHLIVGQDTDSESTPYGAAMSWTVKLDKDQDFIGRWALEHRADDALETTLVGFTGDDGHVPTEGSVVLGPDGAAAGQVTSSRWSPHLGRVIGIAWVPAALAGDGARIEISDEGRRVAATVQTRPFYDPDGEVLRS